jgi:poly-gamma-glutamate synthesis protein (capsule biosynthesis protein)
MPRRQPVLAVAVAAALTAGAASLAACAPGHRGEPAASSPPAPLVVSLSGLPSQTLRPAGAGPRTLRPPPYRATSTSGAADARRRADRGEPPLRRVTLAFTGDTLVHSPIVEQARRNAGGSGYDFRPMFERIAPLLALADVAVCHLETPVVPRGAPLGAHPLYGVPPEVGVALGAAGYQRCSTASNHALDQGAAGVDATIAALAVAGVDQSGMAASATGAAVRTFEVAGVRLAHLSYTFSFNGLRPPSDEPWRSNLIDPVRIVDDAAEARRLGAEVVVVSLHWGVEGVADVTPAQRRLAEQITQFSDIDLVVGHHAHVLQPIEQVNGTWVVYGLGNLLSNMPTGDRWPAGTQDGAIVFVTAEVLPNGRALVGRPVVAPTWVERGPFVVRPVVGDLESPDTPEHVRRELLRSRDRTARVLGDFFAPG